MDFLLNHWHCILPVVGILAAMFFLRDKSKNTKKDDANRLDSHSSLYDKE